MTGHLADRMTPDPTGRPALHPGRAKGDHQRLLLMALVEADPGIHIMRVTHLLALNWNTCYHHARRLAIEGRIVMRKVQGRLCLFDPRAGAVGGRIGPVLLRDQRTAGLARAILASPGANQKELAQALGLSPSVVHRHVLRLERAGLVQRVPKSRSMAVYATDGLAEAWPVHGAETAGPLMPTALAQA